MGETHETARCNCATNGVADPACPRHGMGDRTGGLDPARGRSYIGPMIDAVLNEWRSGIHPDNDEAGDWLAAWWETDDCSDAALQMAHAVVQGLNEAGFEIVAAVRGVS